VRENIWYNLSKIAGILLKILKAHTTIVRINLHETLETMLETMLSVSKSCE
jgi:hypothetical protein